MFAALVILLLAQRAVELILSRFNQRWALARGGRESGRSHYPVIVGMHSLFYVALVLERVCFRREWSTYWAFWLGVLALSQVLRIWAVVSLGRLWNTRIIVIPGSRPSLKGPYRYIRHPNYLVVVAEILAVPMLVGAYLTALIFSVANVLILTVRIREEEKALEGIGAAKLSHLPRFIPRLGRSTTPMSV